MKHFFKAFIVFLNLVSINSYSQSGWSIQNSGTFENINAIKFYNESTGWAVGNAGVVRKTTNGGTNWVTINTGSSTNNYCLQIHSQNTISIGSENLKLLRTTDAGTTWTTQSLNGGTQFIDDINFVNSTLGYLIEGSNNSPFLYSVLQTTNGGVSWDVPFNFINPRSIYFFPSSTKGWMVGKKIDVNFAYTTNGIDWTFQLIGDTTRLNKVHFVSTSIGYIAGNRGKIYKSVNGGLNWTSQNSNTTTDLKDIVSSNPDNAWAIGDNGLIVNTKDGGTTWVSQLSPTSQNLNSIYIPINSTTGWIAGNQGIILKTVNGGVGVKQISSSVPSEYKLFQNYPNPFNPTTNIKFQVPRNSFVNLEMYDINGKLISSLLSEQLNSGSYEFKLNGSNLSSGIYFVKLQSNLYTSLIKIILAR